MKKSLCCIFMLAILIQIGELPALRAEQYSKPELAQGETALEVLFNRVLISRKDGESLSGLLVGIEGNYLIVRAGTKDERIQYNTLEKIVIQKDKKKGPYALSGMLLGFYVANMASLRAENQPTFFIEDIEPDWDYFLWSALYAAAGGGLGILVSSVLEKREKVFEFTGNIEKQNREWERLRRFIIGDTYDLKKVHFKFQGGKVITRVSDRNKNLLLENGFYISNYGWLDYESWIETSGINLLRKVQLTYSLNSYLDVGIASSWIGEPSFRANKWRDGESSYVWQKLSSTGFYAVGVFKPLHKMRPKRISWEIGIGVGAAKVDFTLKARSNIWDPPAEVNVEHKISKTLFSGIVFSELSLYLYDSMSLGLIADYAYVPEQQTPVIPFAGLPAQKLRLGNSSIGFSLGFHF